jgi:phosphoribosylaminoimidazolecarboxamide formyltransferase/IMP cyclohydrolase
MVNALISVSDKTGLEKFLKDLKALGELNIIATSSTYAYIKELGIDAKKVEDLTQFPEILGGRVKTLHPKVFAGILYRDQEEDGKVLKEIGVEPLDLVVVNLYPFEKKLAEGLPPEKMVEQIDIGGPSLIRAAAKNHKYLAIACQPDQYESIIESMKANGGKITDVLRKQLCLAAFTRTAEYDRQISNYFLKQQQAQAKTNGSKTSEVGSEVEALPPSMTLNLSQFQSLRYGENPHQAAVWYADSRSGSKAGDEATFPPFIQLQGKELSSNNITDTYCLVRILRDAGNPASCIIKHNNPCGVAVGATLDEAFEKAYSTDPVSAFGGIYGFTSTLTEALARKIVEGFVEIVAAPDFEEGALKVLSAKKNVRVLKFKPNVLAPKAHDEWSAKYLQDFGWIIEKDTVPPVTGEQFQKVSGADANKGLLTDAQFAWSVVKHLTSNAIFIAKDGKSLGFGIGQTSRIASVRIALEQAGETARGAVLASDAFFPATDNIDACKEAGISLIVQPGGSIKDKDVIEACEKAGITMLFTGQRCFKH